MYAFLISHEQALRHSKVKLTWDQDDPNRIKVTRRALTRDEIEEEDFKAYIASSGSEDEADIPPQTDFSQSVPNLKPKQKTKKPTTKERTKQLRALLLAGGDEDDDVWGKDGSSWHDEVASKKGGIAEDEEIEITFRPGLDMSKAVHQGDDDKLTTLEKYQMRMKERKARKKEKMELKRASKDDDEGGTKATKGEDEFFGDDFGSDDERPPLKAVPVPSVAKSIISNDLGGEGGVEHFSIKDIMKAEKAEGKMRKRKRPGKGAKGFEIEREVELGPSDWKIDVKDQRFKALNQEPEFAIDPSDPQCVIS